MPVYSTDLFVLNKKMNVVSNVVILEALNSRRDKDTGLKIGLMKRVTLIELRNKIVDILDKCKDDESF